jgi:O-antigen/teichoic acid export membrane protein
VLGVLFPSIPRDQLLPAAATLVLLFAGQGLSLVGSAFAAYFGGRQRTASATAVLVPARFLSLIATCVAAFLGADLVVLGVAFVAPLLGGVVVLARRFAREARDVPQVPAAKGTTVQRLLRFSGTLMFWNLCMLVVSGVDVAVVGRLDFTHVALYSVASTIAVGIAGLDNALLAPLLPEMSGRIRLGEVRRAGELLGFATRINAIFLFGSFVAVGALAPVLSALLLPTSDPRTVAAVMLALAGANCLRLTMAPLSLAFIAGGTHTRLIVQPVLEALANLGASIALGMMLGALGVALGTIVGAVVGLIAAVSWSLRVSGEGIVSAGVLLLQALVLPALAWAPALCALVVVGTSPLSTDMTGVAVAVAGIVLSLPGAIWLLGPAGRRPMRRLLPSRLR